MLKIWFGVLPDAIYNTSEFFNNVYLDSWLEDPLDRQMIKAVDRGEVLGPNAVRTKALGIISPTQLSGGVKTLLLMHHIQDKIFNASNCGDNCARWILKMGREQDLTINLLHIMDFGKRRMQVEILNNRKVVTNMGDLAEYGAMFL